MFFLLHKVVMEGSCEARADAFAHFLVILVVVEQRVKGFFLPYRLPDGNVSTDVWSFDLSVMTLSGSTSGGLPSL